VLLIQSSSGEFEDLISYLDDFYLNVEVGDYNEDAEWNIPVEDYQFLPNGEAQCGVGYISPKSASSTGGSKSKWFTSLVLKEFRRRCPPGQCKVKGRCCKKLKTRRGQIYCPSAC